jgi:hypothetical protein
MEKLKRHKSPGIDEIPAKLIKADGRKIRSEIHKLIDYEGPKVSGLTYKNRAKWKILRGIYSAIYGEDTVDGEVTLSVSGGYLLQ